MSRSRGVTKLSAKNPKTTVGNPGQHLERRLEEAPGARPRVLAEVDRRPEPQRDRDEARPERDDDRPADEREDAEIRRLEERRPVLAREEVDDADLAEELERGSSSAKTMPTVVATDTSAHRASRPLMTSSP